MIIIVFFNTKTYDIVHEILMKYLFDPSNLNKHYIKPEVQTIA